MFILLPESVSFRVRVSVRARSPAQCFGLTRVDYLSLTFLYPQIADTMTPKLKKTMMKRLPDWVSVSEETLPDLIAAVTDGASRPGGQEKARGRHGKRPAKKGKTKARTKRRGMAKFG